MKLVVDIETNGLYSIVSKIHCIVARDIDTDQLYIYHPLSDKVYDETVSEYSSIESILHLLNNANLIVGHNFIDYDYRVLKKLYPKETKIKFDKMLDTLLMSHMLFPDLERHPDCPASKIINSVRKQIGKHSLESWGYHLGTGKIEHEDWSEFSEAMLKRCISDTEITKKLFNKLTSKNS